ncbi:CapA family protein [Bacillaceae bacterium S4-13-58]
MKKKNGMFFSLSIAFILIISTLIVYQFTQKSTEKEIKPVSSHALKTREEQTAKSFETAVTLRAIGDILIHSPLYRDAWNGEDYDFRTMLEFVKPLLLSADITFANQETILGGVEMGLSSYPQFNSPVEVGEAFFDAGVDIVSNANNHSLDLYEKGVLNSTKNLSEIGLEYVGSFNSFEDQATSRILKRNGMDIGFLAYTYGTNGIVRPPDKPYLVNYINEEEIIRAVQELKKQTDFIIISLHFGNEYQPLPSSMQKELATSVINQGADIILGHHPHVLQPAEWITRADGSRGFVIYSLGNFISGQTTLDRRIGGIMELTLTHKVGPIGTENSIGSPVFTPTYVYHSNYTNYKIVSLYEASKYGLPNSNSIFENTKAHMTQWVPDMRIRKYFTE